MPGKARDVKVGDFSLPATGGGTFKLSDQRGKTLVVYFYPKDNTPGCTLEGTDFRDRYKEFARAGAEVVGVSRDSVKSHEGFKAKTLILAGEGDLLNPEANAREAAQYIPDARYMTIKTRTALGHWSGAGATAPENELQNREIGAFLDIVTDGGRKSR